MKTRKQWAAERRQRNRELAQADRLNRCGTCKRDLREVGQVLEDFLMNGKFCSDSCLAQAREQSNGPAPK